MGNENQVFELLAKPLQNIAKELGLSRPTEPQVRAIPHILEGENVLLVAPTGSGKTEAVFLPIFSRIVEKPERRGISVLYIAPLRALNRDMTERMSRWAEKLKLSIQVRHGDTATSVRRKQAIQPPDILITTPETLQAILPGSRMRKHLSQVESVIVDEVHELATEKRGLQLTVALERLSDLVGGDFQRIGLSATIENPRRAASFITGSDRPVRILEIPLPKGYKYTIEFPTPLEQDYDLAEKLGTSPEGAARIRRMLELVRKHKSTLIFVNSRTNAEMLGHKFSLLTDDIAVHHGSLSRSERRRTEKEFKSNLLKAIVCTSTMELGVDIGQVDLVIQYLSPRQALSLIQRVGRSGHRLDLVSKGVVVTAYSEDSLESLAAVRSAREGKLEAFLPHEDALDVVAHQIAGITMDNEAVSADDALRIFNQAHPFRNLSKAKLMEVAEYLHYLREIKLEGETLRRTRRTREYYYQNLSMIPDERRYPIIDVVSDRKIGTLGDEFMTLRARVGLSFICRGQVWRIVQIEDEHNTVYVVPSEDRFAAIPGWDGEMLPISLNLAREVGKLRRKIEGELKRSGNVDSTAESLAAELKVGQNVLFEPVQEVNLYIKDHVPVPTHNQILVEGFNKYVVVHACFGELVNRTLGSIFDAILSNHELIAGWWNDGYRVLIETPRKLNGKTLSKVSRLLFKHSSREVDEAFKEFLEARFPFSSRMKFVAERFGALPRGKTLSAERMAELPSRFKTTPIYEETVREAFVEKVDVPTVKRIMKDVHKGRIKVYTLVRREKPTPFAYRMFAKYADVGELMVPEHLLSSNIGRMKNSALSRMVRLMCFSCGDLIQDQRIRDLPERLVCAKCGSGLFAKLMRNQTPTALHALIRRRQEGRDITPEELEELVYARRTADLVLSYGRKALVALQTRGVGPETAFRILGRMHPTEDEFYVDLLKAKIQFIKTSPYWKRRDNKKAKILRGEASGEPATTAGLAP
ncbi:MAG: DEAD/DEAH box helicase [Candidatus Bathyarchaeota archaeon]|nr:DEAD/DEAH box helicase [Candidatus Bathyarchaeota archaeon]